MHDRNPKRETTDPIASLVVIPQGNLLLSSFRGCLLVVILRRTGVPGELFLLAGVGMAEDLLLSSPLLPAGFP